MSSRTREQIAVALGFRGIEGERGAAASAHPRQLAGPHARISSARHGRRDSMADDGLEVVPTPAAERRRERSVRGVTALGVQPPVGLPRRDDDPRPEKDPPPLRRRGARAELVADPARALRPAHEKERDVRAQLRCQVSQRMLGVRDREAAGERQQHRRRVARRARQTGARGDALFDLDRDPEIVARARREQARRACGQVFLGHWHSAGEVARHRTIELAPSGRTRDHDPVRQIDRLVARVDLVEAVRAARPHGQPQVDLRRGDPDLAGRAVSRAHPPPAWARSRPRTPRPTRARLPPPTARSPSRTDPRAGTRTARRASPTGSSRRGIPGST